MLRGLLGAALTGEALQIAGRARRAAILLAFAGVMLAIGIGFLIGAGYILAARQFGNLEAATGFGAAFVVIGLACLLANRIAADRARRRRQAERGPELRGIAVAAALAALPSLLRHPRAVLSSLALPAAGLIALRIVAENRPRPGNPEAET
jgi:hypothetical protein